MKTTPANLESLSGWAAALVLSLGILLASATVTAQSSESKPSEQGQFTVPNPGADLWKAVRAANPGNTQVQGVETGVLINSSGESWRQMRNGPIRRYTGWLLSGTLLWILLSCYRKTCSHHACMTLVSPDRVFAELLRLSGEVSEATATGDDFIRTY